MAALYKKFAVHSPREKDSLNKTLQMWEGMGALRFHRANNSILVINPAKLNPQHSATKGRPISEKVVKPPLRLEGVEQDFSIIVDRHDLPRKFSGAVLRDIDDEVWQDTPDPKREDFRSCFVMTIDGEDSKDLDDAVHVKKTAKGWELGVHIADVSHFVPINSAIDNEARTRANSYYLIDKVIPMLPQKLSNDLCSLNPNEDKRSMSIIIDYNERGVMNDYRITPSTINTKFRMTYKRVQEIMDGAPEDNAELVQNIKVMEELFRLLLKNRLEAGSVDFNFKERKIILDEAGMPLKVYLKDRIDSERLIEEFMLAANIAAALFLHGKGLGVYRVHDVPPPEKYVNLKAFAAKQGVKLPDAPKPKDLQAFLKSLEGSSLAASAEIFTLRSMAQAVYQADNIGHFGLGFEFYSHFTSPIRRYADLLVHRLIKHFLAEPSPDNPAPYEYSWLEKTCSYISGMERTAMEAERDFYKIKSVRYMKPMEGEEMDGKISSVASFGIFVEIMDTGIEAMVRYSDMAGYVQFDEASLSARGGKKTYRLGDPVRIRLTRVNAERGFIDGEFLEKQ